MIPKEVKYELDFIEKSTIIPFISHANDYYFNKSLEKLDNLVSSGLKKISIVSFNESFRSIDDIESISELLKGRDIEYYISASTSSKVNNFFNPLTNIYFWKNTRIRNDIKWASDYLGNNTTQIFKLNNFDKYTNKTNKGILSIRKETKSRNYLDSIIDKDNFEGIYRYIKYPYSNKIELDDEYISKFPNIVELISEYKKTFISFVLETSLGDHFLNPLTEKTLIAFLTKTMPVVLGGKNYVKELKDMGFYVWNDEFGFEDGDIMESDSFEKIDKFNQCLNNFNKISKSEIENIYKKNIDKIENNYNIIKSILFDNKHSLI